MTQAATLAQLASSGALSADTSGNVTAGASITSSQSITIGTSGVYQAGSLYSDVNWGMIFRAKQASPVQAEFRFANAADTERMRIDTSGNLCVGTTNNQPGGATYPGQMSLAFAGGTSKTGINIATTSSAASKMIEFQFTGFGVAGVITTTTSSTAYTTSSDYRLKDNIVSMTGALDKVAQLNPVTWNWKFDGSEGQGFIAHELQEVVSEAVVGEKDAVDENGKPIYQTIDTSFLVATLTKAIQELKAELDVCKAEIAALKGV